VKVLALWALLLVSSTLSLPETGRPADDAAPGGPVRQGAYRYYLAGIEVSGTQRLTRQHVIALSGLHPGRAVTAQEIESARARLAESGLFTQVAYRLRTTGGGYSVIVRFSIEEPIWRAPVLFDNFVGFTDAALNQAVEAGLPTFDGFVPELPAALERVRAALERLAQASGQPGKVGYLLVDDRLLGLRRYRFRLDRDSGTIPVCDVVLSRASAVLHDELAAKTRALIGSDYSKDYIERYAMQNLIPLERRQGYLRARVSQIDATRSPAGAGRCDGAQVSIAIEDGIQYRWRGPAWSGNTVFAPADLDGILRLTPGDLADGSKIDLGFAAIADAYRSKGYLGVAIHSEPAFDDAGRQVAYSVRIVEGGRFRMGKLEIVGLDPELTERVTGQWQMGKGDVFDPSYAARFLADVRATLGQALAPFKQIETQTRPDSRALTVDVAIRFRTPGPPAAAPPPSSPGPARSRP
jgi:outer membrane protein assembly factor BamA